MSNEILQIRASIQAELAGAVKCTAESFSEWSPCDKFRLEVTAYASPDHEDGPRFAVAVVRSTVGGEIIATVNRNSDRCFYAWISREGSDYLILPEDLEGVSVIDLRTGQVEGYSTPGERFIWAEIHPSPDGTRLAVIGCYWACPYELHVYDFSNPMELPYPRLASFDLPENLTQFGGWVDSDSFTMKLGADSRVFAVP
jgi:hypothetical protein